MTWPIVFSSLIGCSFILEEAVNPKSAKDSVRYLQTNAGAWINVDLGSQIELQAVEWRVWQRKKSPESHHSMFKPSDRSALLHHDPRIPKRDPIKDDQ
jgi:hypothetical protein